MLHPATLVRFIDDEIGSGVFARTFIPKGTIVWVLDELDRVFTEEEVRRMAPPYQEVLERYCFRNDRAHWVFPWDNTRFVNHSFTPNCLGTQLGYEIAVEDIAAGEELTNDYGSLNIIEPFDCLPEAGAPRQRVMPDDLTRHAEDWDRLIAEAFPHLSQVDQPLSRLFSADRWDDLLTLSRNSGAPASLRQFYCGTPS